MAEDSTTTDLAALTRGLFEASNGGAFDAMMSFYAPDAVWDMSNVGMGTYQGPAAIRGFFEDWRGAYEELAFALEEVVDLGNGVTFAVVVQTGRPVGSSGEVRLRYGAVGEWAQGAIVRFANYTDVDEARAAAERLAESRR
jgi:ketosteroid isomerase-like protein